MGKTETPSSWSSHPAAGADGHHTDTDAISVTKNNEAGSVDRSDRAAQKVLSEEVAFR